VAVHILRLALSGSLDRHPRLKLLIGHMGEGLPTMMERVERVFSGYSNTHLERNAARAIVEQVWVSTSGFSGMPAFLAAFMTFSADRLLFSVDYPFGNNSAAVAFLKSSPVSPTGGTVASVKRNQRRPASMLASRLIDSNSRVRGMAQMKSCCRTLNQLGRE
jgi:predicted TIM-barrel fold metal-dependent hydrolase